MTPTNGQPPATGDDLRRLEGRIDALLQEVIARLVLLDGRFAATTDRLNQLDRRADSFAARMDARFGAINARFDSLDTRHDHLDARNADLRAYAKELVSDYRAAMVRATVIGVAGTLVVNASMIGATAWLAFR